MKKKTKNLKNNKIKKIIFIILTVVFLLIIIKGLVAISYSDDKEINYGFNTYIDNYSEKTIKVESKSAKEYYKFSDIKMENIFEDYELKETDSENHVIFYKDDDVIFMRRLDSTYTELTKDKVVFKNEDKIIEDDFDSKNIKKYLEKNNVTNQEELDKLICNGMHINIFTSLSDIKAINSIKKYVAYSVPYVENIDKLTGDVDGLYIKYTDNLYAAEIYKGQYKYIISFTVKNETPSKEFILDLISTIK